MRFYLEEKLDSFGFKARDKFNDLKEPERQKWLFFEKFKMILHLKDVRGIKISEHQ